MIGLRGRTLIREAEGCRLTAYQDSAGVWTIGYGSTHNVAKGMCISEAEAESRFDQDLVAAESTINYLVTVPLTQSMRDALISWVFNFGYRKLRVSTLLRKLNAREYEAVPDEIRRWTWARDAATGKMVELAGLIERRRAEADLFLADGYPPGAVFAGKPESG